MESLCANWEFTKEWTDSFLHGEGSFDTVRLPHTVQELPLHYADHMAYQMLCGYRKKLDVTEEMLGKRLFLQFDGAAHIATVYVNGAEVAHHATGYTGFRCEITDLVTPGETVLIAVKLDTSENPATPPFGHVIDYLTYGGLYREVWLDIREQSYIEDIFVTTPRLDSLHIEMASHGSQHCRFTVAEEDGTILLTKETSAPADLVLPNARPWSNEDPHR